MNEMEELKKRLDKVERRNRRMVMKMHKLHKICQLRGQYPDGELIDLVKEIVYKNTKEGSK